MDITKIKKSRTKRESSWDRTGRNKDSLSLEPGKTAVIADIKGPGTITHIWMTQNRGYRDTLLKIYWDDEPEPSVLCPLGDFFCLGNEIVNSFQSYYLTASSTFSNKSNVGCALNCYFPMPFNKSARIELLNEGEKALCQYFYVDYEAHDEKHDDETAYFHANFRRENPCGGWGNEIGVNTPEANIVNAERLAWENNYVILDAVGTGHYVGCNLSVANFQGQWWGEGDDMIWVDGYKWPPDLHGTGSEDYFNQAWGMQDNAFLRNGSSVFEGNIGDYVLSRGGFQTSYVFHVENPVRFTKEIKVTIEHGHGNHLSNDYTSVAYWYQLEPHKSWNVPSVEQRKPAILSSAGDWINDAARQTPGKAIELNTEMIAMKKQYRQKMNSK